MVDFIPEYLVGDEYLINKWKPAEKNEKKL